MSLAERTREAAREHPFLLAGLRAGVINHRAAAEFLALDGDGDAVATALRRFAETLPEYRTESRDVRVTMHSGVGVVESSAVTGGDGVVDSSVVTGDDVEAAASNGDCGSNVDTSRNGDVAEPTLLIGDTAVVPDAGDATAVVATGDVDAAGLQAVLGRLTAADVDVLAAGVDGATLVVVVERRAGPGALREVEAALAAVPA